MYYVDGLNETGIREETAAFETWGLLLLDGHGDEK